VDVIPSWAGFRSVYGDISRRVCIALEVERITILLLVLMLLATDNEGDFLTARNQCGAWRVYIIAASKGRAQQIRGVLEMLPSNDGGTRRRWRTRC
jgi:hypothetical protein